MPSERPHTVPDAGKTNPGDEAPPGMPGTGEDICPECHGSGKVNGQPCRNCGGTGRVVRGIGGA
jgi:DnaJ-class molecular chaperone